MRKAADPVPPSNPSKFDAKRYAKPGLSEAEVVSTKESFDLFDAEGVGSINPKQLKIAMQALGYQSTHHTVYQLICDFDADGKGSISFDDFLHLMTHTVSSSDQRGTIEKVFALYDDEKTGYLSIKNLRRVAQDLGEDITQKQLQLMLERADTDKDGYVSASEFYSIISRKIQI